MVPDGKALNKPEEEHHAYLLQKLCDAGHQAGLAPG